MRTSVENNSAEGNATARRVFASDPCPGSLFGHGFADVIGQYDWDETLKMVEKATEADVRRVLAKARRNVKPLSPDEFAVLISESADPYMEDMARLSRRYTQERFGKTISMYIPMYVSNACTNKCVYCGFNHDNPFTRKTLTLEEVENECKAIRRLGPFENLLIVSGEYPSLTGVEYLEKVLHVCRPYFHNLTIEVMPMKARDRMGEAGVHKIGMGALLGLEDWRGDAVMLARHLRYLQKRYWRTRFSVNFPRMRPSESGFQPKSLISDRQLARLTFAFRIFDHDADISYSTREAPSYRDHILSLGVTSMSAGSQTEPGGYATSPEALEQFEVSDSRCPADVADAIRRNGYEPVWKDWDQVYDI